MNPDKLSVIIVNWNTRELLGKCLGVLSDGNAFTAGRIFVVDNGSSDGSAAMVREKYPDVVLLENGVNLGYGAAHNKALGLVSSEYVLFLNTDVTVTEGVLSGMLEFMKGRPDTGICSPRLVNKDGSPQETAISLPSVWTEFFGRIRKETRPEAYRTPAVRGACMMARARAIKDIGGFDDRYFLFLEETDLCARLNKCGYEVWCLPYLSVIHTKGMTASADKIGARIEYWRSRYLFFRKHYSRPAGLILNAGMFVKLPLDLAASLVLLRKEKIKTYFTVILWHILGRPGDWGITFCSAPAPASAGNILPERLTGACTVIKENDKRKVCRYDNGVFAKQYKNIKGKPWRREWRLINRLRQLDIPTATPLFLKDKTVFTEELAEVRTLHDLVSEGRMDFGEKIALTEELAHLVAKLHRKGVFHRDLHAGNILVRRSRNRNRSRDAKKYYLYVTDLHRANIKLFLSAKEIKKNLSQLDMFFSVTISGTARYRFISRYIKAGGNIEKKDIRDILQMTERACQKLWKKRDRLYLKKRKYAKRGKLGDIRYVINPRYEFPDIFKAIQAGQKHVIKDSRSSYVYKVNVPCVGDVMVKENRQKKIINYLKDIFRLSRAYRAWSMGWALLTRRINTPEPVLAYEQRRFGILKKSVIVTKYIPESCNLSIFAQSNPTPSDIEGLGRKLSPYIKAMQERGVDHPGMKGNNIILQNRGANFYVVDLDHAKIKKKVALKERFCNIRQIYRTTGVPCFAALPVRKILVIKPSSLGDIAQAISVLAAIKRFFPGVSVWWIANRQYMDFLKMVPGLDGVTCFDRKRWGRLVNLPVTLVEFFSFIRGIRKKRFDIVFDLQGLLRSGIIAGLSGARIRCGFGPGPGGAREFAWMFYNCRAKTIPLNAKERYAETVFGRGIPFGIPKGTNEKGFLDIPKETLAWAESLWDKGKSLRVIINPGARWPSKIWGVEKFAETARMFADKCEAGIVITGDKDDRKIAETLNSLLAGAGINTAGETDLFGLCALINTCDIFITNDSGPMHIADYLGKPTVAVFGPTDPARTGPTGIMSRVIKKDVSCGPCFKKICGNSICLDSLNPKDVFSAAFDLLQKTSTVV